MEDQIRCLLRGEALQEDVLCDYSIVDQNEAAVAKGIRPSTTNEYKPIVKHSVTYIVAGVLINDKSEVLMMQEAKKTCAGMWYLPAGRVEPGETLQEAVKREVLEETGLHMEPTSLLSVEAASGSWFRFAFAGQVIGGELKTPAQADKESLQAKWVANVKELNLRGNDILDLIDRAKAFSKKGKRDPWHENIMPSLHSHNMLLLRLVVCIKQRASNRLHILLSEKNQVHLPLCELYPSRNVHATLRKFMTEIFGADLPTETHKPRGLLNVEYCGDTPDGQHDGLLLTLLVTFKVPLEEAYPIDKYSWVMVSKELEMEINLRIPKNMILPLCIVR